MAQKFKYGNWAGVDTRLYEPFGKMSGTSAIFIVALIGIGLFFWIKRPKRRN